MPLQNAKTKFFAWTEGRYPPPRDVAFPNRLIIPFHIQWQEMTKWCWSAVASSISYHFDDNSIWDQVEIVAEVFGYDEQAVPDESWNQPLSIEAGLDVVGCFAGGFNYPISFGRVLSELRQQRPVCVQINWDPSHGHAVVITGCWLDEQNNAFYRVSDPHHILDCPNWPPHRELSEKQLLKYLNEGTWKKSFFVCPPRT